jgi:hypothetical protein
MSRLRWTLVALLIASTALFAVGVIAERSDADEHAKAENAEVRTDGEQGAHAEDDAAGDAEGPHEEGEATGSKATHADKKTRHCSVGRPPAWTHCSDATSGPRSPTWPRPVPRSSSQAT